MADEIYRNLETNEIMTIPVHYDVNRDREVATVDAEGLRGVLVALGWERLADA